MRVVADSYRPHRHLHSFPTRRSSDLPATAWNPPKALRTSRTSSTPRPREPARHGADGPGDAAGEDEEQDHEHGAEHERPVFRVGHDLLGQEGQPEGADGGAVEGPHAPEP